MKLASVIAVAMTSCLPPAASAQGTPHAGKETYPSRPVRMIAPFPAGGPTDIVARTIARQLSDAWGQQVIVDNRGGANGVIAQDIAAKSAPDGHTLFVHSVAYVVNPLPSGGKRPHDNERDFVPVSLVVEFPLMLTIHPALPAELGQGTRGPCQRNHKKLNYSSHAARAASPSLRPRCSRTLAASTSCTCVLIKVRITGLLQ